MSDNTWLPIADAPRDKEIEIKQGDGEFSIRAYWGGGADKAWRSVTTHRQIIRPEFYRPLPVDL